MIEKKTLKKNTLKKATMKTPAAKKTSSKTSNKENSATMPPKISMQDPLQDPFKEATVKKVVAKRASTITPKISDDKIEALKALILETLDSNKALDILPIALKNKSYADYVIIATGTSSKHLATIKDKLITVAKDNKFTVLGSEGEETGNWIIVDLNSIIVHLFRDEVRKYYDIEKIWLD